MHTYIYARLYFERGSMNEHEVGLCYFQAFILEQSIDISATTIFSLPPTVVVFHCVDARSIISVSFSFNKNEKWRHGVCRTSAPTHAQLSYTITIYVQYKHNSYMHLIYRSANKSTYSCKLVAHPRNLTYIAFITRNWYTAIAKKADTLTRTKITEWLRMEMN